MPELVWRLGEIRGVEWIRIMYSHPARADVLLDALLASAKTCRYADIPVQHSSSRILAAMGRPGSGEQYLRALEKLRERIPGISLRSTFIVGFPGETGDDFSNLLSFVREARFEHAGAFKFSPEEGTRAYSLAGSVPERTVNERLAALQRALWEVSVSEHRKRLGSQTSVIVDEVRDGLVLGRTEFQAPEIDGITRIPWNGHAVRRGDIVPCTLQSLNGHDFTAFPHFPVE